MHIARNERRSRSTRRGRPPVRWRAFAIRRPRLFSAVEVAWTAAAFQLLTGSTTAAADSGQKTVAPANAAIHTHQTMYRNHTLLLSSRLLRERLDVQHEEKKLRGCSEVSRVPLIEGVPNKESGVGPFEDGGFDSDSHVECSGTKRIQDPEAPGCGSDSSDGPGSLLSGATGESLNAPSPPRGGKLVRHGDPDPMPLKAGSRLGPYRVLALPIGVGRGWGRSTARGTPDSIVRLP